MLVDSQAIMMPGVELAGGSVPAVPPQWPPCKGPSLAPRPQRAGRGPHGHSHCGRGQASPGRRYWPDRGTNIRDHEEHGVISTWLFPNRRMADDALFKAVQNRNLAETNVRRPIAVVVCCGVR